MPLHLLGQPGQRLQKTELFGRQVDPHATSGHASSQEIHLKISNPVFSFERLRAGDELELGRALSFGLLDLISLPWRQSAASRRIEQAQVKLAADVVDQVTLVRQAWVRAVAAQQTLKYAEQVYEASQASAELAQRMQAVGNFNRVSRARQQAFYADAATRLASVSHLNTAAREELVRLLGLNDAQVDQLRLPDRLPDLPKEPVKIGRAHV